MSVNLQRIRKAGTTRPRKAFWDDVFLSVISSQKIAGRSVTVDEHPGKGSVINVADNRRKATQSVPPVFTCPSSPTMTVVVSGLTFGCCGSFGTGSLELADISANGTYHLNFIGSCEWNLFPAGDVSVTSWSSLDCSGSPSGTTTDQLFIDIRQTSYSGGVGLYAAILWSATALFVNYSFTTLPATLPNLITSCGSILSVVDPINFGPTAPTVAYGGTMAVSIP